MVSGTERTARLTRTRWIVSWLICAAGALGTAVPRSVWASYPAGQTDDPGDWTTAVRITNTAGGLGTANLFAMQTTPAGLIDLSFVTVDHNFASANAAAPGGFTLSGLSMIGVGNEADAIPGESVNGAVDILAGDTGVLSVNVATGQNIQQQMAGGAAPATFPDVAEFNVQVNPALLNPVQAAAIENMIPVSLAAAPATPFVFNEHGFGTSAVPITPAETAQFVAGYTANYIVLDTAYRQTPAGGSLGPAAAAAQAVIDAATPAVVAAITAAAGKILYVQHSDVNGNLPAAEDYGTERYFVQTASQTVANFGNSYAPYYSYTAMQWTLPTPAAATLQNPDAGGLFGDSGSGILYNSANAPNASVNIVGVLTAGTSSTVPAVGGGSLTGVGVGTTGDAIDFNQAMVNELNQLSLSFFAPEPSSGMLLAVGALVAGICAGLRRARGMGGRV